MRVFKIYGDSWFEHEVFKNTIEKMVKKISETKKQMKKIVVYEYSDIKFKIIYMGSYKSGYEESISEMFLNFSHPDIVLIENNRIILGVEDTETSNVGNSQWQRQERTNYFLENHIPYFYYTYLISEDRSREKNQIRYPSSLLDLYYKKYDSKEVPFRLIYRKNQKDIHDKNLHEVVDFFLNCLLMKKEIPLSGYSELNYKENSFNNKITRLEKDFPILKLENFYKNKSYNWLSDARKYSKIINGCMGSAYSFNKGRQKVGWIKTVHLNKILEENGIDKLDPEKKEYVLVNPIMGFQISGNKKILKKDPATGEFVAFSNLFDDENVYNFAIIYSPNADINTILSSNSELFFAIKKMADLIVLDNSLNLEKIDLTSYKYKFVKKIGFSEDDVLKVVDDYFINNFYERIYISPPSASWSRSNDIFEFIGKNQKRPDYIYKKGNEFIIGEAKDKINKLLMDRNKHLHTFNEFKKMIINRYKNANVTEINSAIGKYISDMNFSYIEIDAKKGEISEIHRKQE